jgi:hypothetical protein
MDGLVDIYMPDFKFWSPTTARRLARAKDYPDVARAAIAEMHRQVGPAGPPQGAPCSCDPDLTGGRLPKQDQTSDLCGVKVDQGVSVTCGNARN